MTAALLHREFLHHRHRDRFPLAHGRRVFAALQPDPDPSQQSRWSISTPSRDISHASVAVHHVFDRHFPSPREQRRGSIGRAFSAARRPTEARG